MSQQKTGTFAIFSIIAAIVSYFATFSRHPIWGMILGIISLPLGIGGILMAASPRVSGGMISIAGIILGLIAIGVSVLGLIGIILF